MESTVLSLRIDGELLERLRGHAARRGMSVQDYVVRTLIREDFDERFTTAVEETEKFYGAADAPREGPGDPLGSHPLGSHPLGSPAAPVAAQVSPSAGIA